MINSIFYLRIPNIPPNLYSFNEQTKINKLLHDYMQEEDNLKELYEKAYYFKDKIPDRLWNSISLQKFNYKLHESKKKSIYHDDITEIRSYLDQFYIKKKENENLKKKILNLIKLRKKNETKRLILLGKNEMIFTILNYTSEEFLFELEKINNSENTKQNKKEKLAKSIHNYLLRGIKKTCPLGFFCSLSISRFNSDLELSNDVQLNHNILYTLEPTVLLLNQLYQKLKKNSHANKNLDYYHVNLNSEVYKNKFYIWTKNNQENKIIEKLNQVAIPEYILSSLYKLKNLRFKINNCFNDSKLTLNDFDKLIQSKIVQNDDCISFIDIDPTQKLLNYYESTPLKDKGIEFIKENLKNNSPRNFMDYDFINKSIKTLFEIGKEFGFRKQFSNTTSINSYKLCQKSLSSSDKVLINRALEDYLKLASIIYPYTNHFKNQEKFRRLFIKKYGINKKVLASKVLIDNWEFFDDVFAYATNNEEDISNLKDVIWNNDTFENEPILKIILNNIKNSSKKEEVSIDNNIISKISIPNYLKTDTYDFTCRLSRNKNNLEIFVESISLSSRTTTHHFESLKKINGKQIIDDYLSFSKKKTNSLDLELIGSAFQKQLVNIQNNLLQNQDCLILDEPFSTENIQSIIRFVDLYIYYDQISEMFLFYNKKIEEAILFNYKSAISPNYNRRLHFLRFISLLNNTVPMIPKWYYFEDQKHDYTPKIKIGNLVLNPKRWSFNVKNFKEIISKNKIDSIFNIKKWYVLQKLPLNSYFYSNKFKKPIFFSFNSIYSVVNFISYLKKLLKERNNNITIFFEDIFPHINDSIVNCNKQKIQGAFIFNYKIKENVNPL